MSNCKIKAIINNLEFTTIDRAARLFECEVSDIEHWVSVQSISAYVYFKSNEIYMKYDDHKKGIFPHNSATKEDLIALDQISSSFKNMKVEGIEAYGFPGGLWQLFSPNILFNQDDEILFFIPIDPPKQSKYQNFTLFGSRKEFPEFILLKKDLLKIYDAIYENKPLKSIYNDKNLENKYTKEQNYIKPSLKQKNLIEALSKYADLQKIDMNKPPKNLIKELIESIPELGFQVTNEPYTALEKVSKYLDSKGTPYPDLTKETLANWIKGK